MAIIEGVFHSITIIVLIGFSCVHSVKFKRENFVFWPNGTIPFYVNTTHFDKEQTLAILSTLSDFAHKTCLQFRPVVTGIHPGYHVLSFENQNGVRRCVLTMEGHAKENPHRLTVGYSCLRSPHLQMLIMKALGFPFEHNRMGRDLYIDVQFENIQPGGVFNIELVVRPELRPRGIHKLTERHLCEVLLKIVKLIKN